MIKSKPNMIKYNDYIKGNEIKTKGMFYLPYHSEAFSK